MSLTQNVSFEYGLKQASRSWHAHLTSCLKTLDFQRCLADACVFCLVEEVRVAIIAVVHVDDIFAVGLKSRCNIFRDELNRMAPRHELGRTEMVGKLPLHTGTGDGYSDDIPENVCR